jgi:hypothetical protein
MSTFTPAPNRYTNAAQAATAMLAGNATITLVSLKSNARYTFKIVASKRKEGDTRPPVHFVRWLHAKDVDDDKSYKYMGMISEAPRRNFVATKATKDEVKGSVAFKAFGWALGQLLAGNLPEQLEVWHEGRCCRCGRKLTVPESIAAGIGPECAGKVTPIEFGREITVPGTAVEAKTAAKVATVAKKTAKADAKELAKADEADSGEVVDFNKRWRELKDASARLEAAREEAAYMAEMEEGR